MNEHASTQRNIAALIAGSLPDAEQTRARAHMAKCAECARQLEHLFTLAKTVKRLPHPELTNAQLTRFTALARVRRQEVIERREHHWVMATLAIYGWVMFLFSLALLIPMNHALEKQFGWPPLVTELTSLILWGTLCWTIGFGLVPLLHLYKLNRQERSL
ncbi:MAG: zf-HC2 domain-containing protein [Acidobacteriia bacterium]|nr:zf-HC2 domain-containing protein [Terriglobia bacterium]